MSVSSSLDDLGRVPLLIAPDSDTLVALRGELSSNALPGAVAMLLIVAVGVVIGYRQARLHDIAGVDTIRYIS